MHPDRAIDDLAAHQYGAFSLRQAKRVGFTQRMVDGRLAIGSWVRLAPSVYAVASAPPRWERQMAAALLSKRGSVAAGSSAAYLHEMHGYVPARPVILVGLETNPRSPIAKVIRSRHFDSIRTTRIKGFPVTDYAETLLTLAASTPSETLERLLDDGLASGSLDIGRMTEVFTTRAGTAGIQKMRGLVTERKDDAWEPPVSELERMLHRLADSPGIPPVRRQMPFGFEQVRMTVDLFIPAWGLIVEADGRRWHTRVADFERDRRRDNEATAHGYGVLRFTYRMLRDEPGVCLDQLVRTGQVRTAS